MNRMIVPYRGGPLPIGGAAGSTPDNAVGRLAKYIPAEVISGYMVLSGLVDAASKESPLRFPAACFIVILGTILTPIYFYSNWHPVGVQRWQLPISTVAFVLWAYALGGPFKMPEMLWIPAYPYESWFAALVAGCFSWAAAAIWVPTEPA